MPQDVVTTLLVSHSRAEEAAAYPVARTEAGEQGEVAHSQEEHAEAEEILEKLRATDHTSAKFDDLLGQLVDAITHHVHEESKVLPCLRDRLDESRRAQLAVAFVTARTKHMGEQPGEATKDDLLQQARNAGIEGPSP